MLHIYCWVHKLFPGGCNRWDWTRATANQTTEAVTTKATKDLSGSMMRCYDYEKRLYGRGANGIKTHPNKIMVDVSIMGGGDPLPEK